MRANPTSLIRLDEEPLGSGAAVHDAKILAAAFLKLYRCPDEVITQVRDLSTPYPGRVFLLASAFATNAKGHGWTSQTWQNGLRYQINYDLKY